MFIFILVILLRHIHCDGTLSGDVIIHLCGYNQLRRYYSL